MRNRGYGRTLLKGANPTSPPPYRHGYWSWRIFYFFQVLAKGKPSVQTSRGYKGGVLTLNLENIVTVSYLPHFGPVTILPTSPPSNLRDREKRHSLYFFGGNKIH